MFIAKHEGVFLIRQGELEFLYADVAIWFSTCLVVIILMIFFAFPKLFSRTENRIHFMSHGTE